MRLALFVIGIAVSGTPDFGGVVWGQTLATPQVLGFSSTWGQIAPHRPEMNGLLGRQCLGVEMSLGWMRAAQWSQAGNREGAIESIAIQCVSTGSETLGMQAALLGLIRWPKPSGFFTETGLGLGWTNAPYDPDIRPTSIALGSSFNAAIRLGLGFAIPFNHQWKLRAFSTLNHLSNGGISQPNLGTNHIAIGIGFDHIHVAKQKKGMVADEAPAELQFSRRIIHAQMGPRDIGLPGNDSDLLFSLKSLRSLQPQRWKRLWQPQIGGGITASIRDHNRPIQTYIEAGGLWTFGKMAVSGTFGGLLTGVRSGQGPIFLQVDIRRSLLEKFQIALSLRSYRMRAEHPALGLIWAF